MCTDAVKVSWLPTLLNINWLKISYAFFLPPRQIFLDETLPN